MQPLKYPYSKVCLFLIKLEKKRRKTYFHPEGFFFFFKPEINETWCNAQRYKLDTWVLCPKHYLLEQAGNLSLKVGNISDVLVR